jgi:hypothetical protein
VLGDGHERGVEHAPLGRIGKLPGDQQPDVIGEADRADQLAAQVAATHHDRFRVGRGNRRRTLRLRTDLQANPSRGVGMFSDSENEFD